jgi:hypothetical protein
VTLQNDLNVAVRQHGQRLMVSGARVFEAEIKRKAPRDTGNLADGITAGRPRAFGSTITVEFKSEATSDSGFDYPAYLNTVRRVAPTRRRYLRWIGPDGPIFSRGFDNQHRRWWSSTVTQKAWQNVLGRIT